MLAAGLQPHSSWQNAPTGRINLLTCMNAICPAACSTLCALSVMFTLAAWLAIYTVAQLPEVSAVLAALGENVTKLSESCRDVLVKPANPLANAEDWAIGKGHMT